LVCVSALSVTLQNNSLGLPLMDDLARRQRRVLRSTQRRQSISSGLPPGSWLQQKQFIDREALPILILDVSFISLPSLSFQPIPSGPELPSIDIKK